MTLVRQAMPKNVAMVRVLQSALIQKTRFVVQKHKFVDSKTCLDKPSQSSPYVPYPSILCAFVDVWVGVTRRCERQARRIDRGALKQMQIQMQTGRHDFGRRAHTRKDKKKVQISSKEMDRALFHLSTRSDDET